MTKPTDPSAPTPDEPVRDPNKSFIRSYATFTTGNESPEVYHSWGALSALSSIMSRRVWVDMGFFTVYPNMYVMFVGNAGIKKSTAMNIAKSIVRAIRPPITIAPSSITREAMTQLMAEEGSPCKKIFKHEGVVKSYTHLSIFANELVTLLNAGGNASGMIETLTDIWDQDIFEVKTKNKGNDYIEQPFLTILGCLTTDTINNLFNNKIISSGFSRRCIFVHSDDFGTPVPRPVITAEQKQAWDDCVARANSLQAVSGQFSWEPSALDWWDTFYRANHERKTKEENSVMQRYLQSKPEYVIKIAMLTTLSETNDLVLTPEQLQLANAFLEQIEPSMTMIFDGSGRNELSPIASAIERTVVGSPQPIMRKKIYAMFFKDAQVEEIDKILTHLARVDKIRMFNLEKDNTTIQFVGSLAVVDALTKRPSEPTA